MSLLLALLLLVPGIGTTHAYGTVACDVLRLTVVNQSSEPVAVAMFGQTTGWFESGESVTLIEREYTDRGELRVVRKSPGQVYHSSITSVADLTYNESPCSPCRPYQAPGCPF